MKDMLPVGVKERIARAVIEEALQTLHNAVLWSGGKDSTLVLYLVLSSVTMDQKLPRVVFIDHGKHSSETWDFIAQVARKWKFRPLVIRNTEAINRGLSLGTTEGNYLLKIVTLNNAIEEHGFEGIITGIRWDEASARGDEVFFSPRDTHIRVHPILPWTEKNVWDFTLHRGLPIHPAYRKGYRSFDSTEDKVPVNELPAWQQDLEIAPERGGRSQDKEGIMRELRKIGYF
jgi:phosphoadenosine phosphosulfate reductase